MIVERTKGELSARCEGEEANFLAINLAHQIVTGRMGVEQARRRYTEAMQAFSQGRRDPDMEGLRFEPPTGGTADPDEVTVAETMLHKLGEKLGLTEETGR